MESRKFFIYILTNANRTVLYIGVTNNLNRRLSEHKENIGGKTDHFTSKYNLYHLIYYEEFQLIEQAIHREKQLKGWSRSKKNKLITDFNPSWNFLEGEQF